MIKQKFGFTLAEVLIVIGIIGVVAALTLPNLNHATGDKETVTKVKKIYASLTDAFDRAQVIYGDFDTWFNDLGEENNSEKTERFAKRVTEFLKVSKDCGFDGGSLDDSEDYLDNGYSVMLADGMAIEFSAYGGVSTIAIDIDGPQKGKNTYKYDIFTFGAHHFDNYVALTPDNRAGIYNGEDGGGEDENGITTIFYSDTVDDYYTAWVVQNGNLDYLKTDEDGKCPNGVQLNWQHTSCN